MLEVADVRSGYGKASVLHDVSIEVSEGEIVALVGTNGAGKTTLLRTITGSLRKRSGTITFDGGPMRSPVESFRSGVSHVPEGRKLFGPMTVKDNLMLGVYGAKRRERAQLLADGYDLVFTLFPYLQSNTARRADSMSGGQQQMLCIGRALMSKPKLLLLDEPSMGLAPMMVRTVMDALASLRARGVAVLLVEQDAGLALEVSQRAYVLRRGSVVDSDNSESLLADKARLQAGYFGIGDDSDNGAGRRDDEGAARDVTPGGQAQLA